MYKIKTYTGTPPTGCALFILNKGMNSGKPLDAPCRNCFVITTATEEERQFYYWLAFGLWQSRAFHFYLRGSVIPFIVMREFCKCLDTAAEKANGNRPAFTKAVETLQTIKKLEESTAQKMRILKEMKYGIFQDFMRKG